MVLDGLKLFRYRLPLTRPLSVVGPVRHSESLITYREGVLIGNPRHPNGPWGDAAPLPGWSNETLDEVISAAKSGHWNRFPSLQFARQSLDNNEITSAARIPINALLAGESEAILAQADFLRNSSFNTVKLKVGRTSSVEEDIRVTLEVSKRLRSNQRLRLDANRAWTWDQAIVFGRAIATSGISLEFVEEPIQRPQDLERWTATTRIPYALDETLRETTDLKGFPHAAALIIKPTLQGVGERIEPILAHGAPVIFSASFESGIGLTHIARLAAQLSPDRAAGLDTYRWLASDLLYNPLNFEEGYLRLDQPILVRQELLEEIH